MKKVTSIILAAGLGKRMRSASPKVLHPVCGKPMLFYSIEALKNIKIDRIVVIGHKGESVKGYFADKGVAFVEQEPQLGTGHAVICTEKKLRFFRGDLLILSGDVPLIKTGTLKGLIRFHHQKDATVSFITTFLKGPTGYGRVIRDDNGSVKRIVEEKDATAKEKAIQEVNTGIYIIRSDFLFSNLNKLKRENAQGEYYLPDLIPLAIRRGGKVAALTHTDSTEVMGVNNRIELAEANRIMRERINRGLMMNGVTIIAPHSTYIDHGIKVGKDTTIYPNAVLNGGTSIGSGCVIEEGSKIIDSSLGRGVTIRSYSIIEHSKIGNGVSIGPFARLRPDNVISNGAKIGNFVEVKNSRVGRGTKVNHLSYIGDAEIGSGVNVGAGTITCNYDGIRKYKTTIHDGVFIGSDTQLIAPVEIGKEAYIGSGSTITRNVPPRSLALSRVEQKIVKEWVEKRKGKAKKIKIEKKEL
ncbi:MAG: bifunctional UDP-N-acetylglucosamine diphosphorylase/glucosamine-1-phosphate N-acetyltransferase GlmU [Thermodesulfobacteriota bacterium]